MVNPTYHFPGFLMIMLIKPTLFEVELREFKDSQFQHFICVDPITRTEISYQERKELLQFDWRKTRVDDETGEIISIETTEYGIEIEKDELINEFCDEIIPMEALTHLITETPIKNEKYDLDVDFVRVPQPYISYESINGKILPTYDKPLKKRNRMWISMINSLIHLNPNISDLELKSYLFFWIEYLHTPADELNKTFQVIEKEIWRLRNGGKNKAFKKHRLIATNPAYSWGKGERIQFANQLKSQIIHDGFMELISKATGMLTSNNKKITYQNLADEIKKTSIKYAKVNKSTISRQLKKSNILKSNISDKKVAVGYTALYKSNATNVTFLNQLNNIAEKLKSKKVKITYPNIQNAYNEEFNKKYTLKTIKLKSPKGFTKKFKEYNKSIGTGIPQLALCNSTDLCNEIQSGLYSTKNNIIQQPASITQLQVTPENAFKAHFLDSDEYIPFPKFTPIDSKRYQQSLNLKSEIRMEFFLGFEEWNDEREFTGKLQDWQTYDKEYDLAFLELIEKQKKDRLNFVYNPDDPVPVEVQMKYWRDMPEINTEEKYQLWLDAYNEKKNAFHTFFGRY